MADVNLVIKADNKDAVKGIKETQTEAQKLNAINKDGINVIDALSKSLEILKAKREKAYDDKEIKKLDNAIKKTKQDLDDLSASQDKSKSKTESISQMIGKWALSLGGATIALRLIKDAILATTTGLNAFNIAGAAGKQVMYNLITGAGDLTKGLENVIAAQKELNRLRLQEKIDTFHAKVEMLKYNKALEDAADKTKNINDRIKDYDNAKQHLKKATDIEIKSTEESIAAYVRLLKVNEDDEKIKIAIIDLETKLIDLRDQESRQLRMLISAESTLKNKEWKDQLDRWHKEIEEQNKIDEANWKRMQDDLALKELMERYTQEYFDKEHKRNQDELSEIELMERYTQEYFDKEHKRDEKDLDFQRAIAKSRYEIAKAAWEKMIRDEKLLADAEEKVLKARQDNLELAGDAVLDYISIIEQLNQREVDHLQRKRELYDTRISETQSAIETELELQKAGYASNVGAKQKELDELKKQREKALKDEEAAIKKAHSLKVAQLLAEKAVALAKVIMSSEIAKAEARILMANPVTLVPGIALLSTIRISEAISIAAISASVVAASLSKFAKGGWTGRGGQRDSTGERVAGLVHEEEFVVKRGPAHRFREVLEAINRDDRKNIFNSFNKISPELLGGTTINNVVVDNNGSNDRLDKLIAENKKLNAKLQGESVQDFGRIQVIRKGNVTRTIRR